VFSTGTDPVALGLVANLNRPGDNLTGTASASGPFFGKAVELLHELMPQARSVARLANPANPRLEEERVRATDSVVRTLGLRLMTLYVSNPSEIAQAFETLEKERPAGVLISSDLLFFSQHGQIITLAARHRVPAIFEGGGIMPTPGP
jgi:putative ABC transport system substrate-binding protein